MSKLALKDTTCIMFNGGDYGKYLYWILNNFTTDGLKTDISTKAIANGSAHNQEINGVRNDPFIADQYKWLEYIKGNTFYPYYVRHIVEGADLNDPCWEDPWLEVDEVSRTVKKVIVISNTRNLQGLNNVFEKTFKSSNDYFNKINRFDDFKVDVNDISAVREMLSYKLFYLDYRLPVEYNYRNVLHISLFKLLWNFEETITNIVRFLGTELTIPLHELHTYHSTFLANQRHLNKDAEIKEFLQCFENNIHCKMPIYSTIIDEAYIQHYLRDKLKLEIKCYNLTTFPDTTSELHKITFPEEELQRE